MSESRSMTDLVEAYLESRHRLGVQLHFEGWALRSFARYADESGHRGPLTTELAVRWARLAADATPIYQARRLGVVRVFARYRAIFDPGTEIPPEGLLGRAPRRPTPPYLHGVRTGDTAGRRPKAEIADRPAPGDLRDADRPAELHRIADLGSLGPDPR
jgi:hypothetical protein